MFEDTEEIASSFYDSVSDDREDVLPERILWFNVIKLACEDYIGRGSLNKKTFVKSIQNTETLRKEAEVFLFDMRSNSDIKKILSYLFDNPEEVHRNILKFVKEK